MRSKWTMITWTFAVMIRTMIFVIFRQLVALIGYEAASIVLRWARSP